MEQLLLLPLAGPVDRLLDVLGMADVFERGRAVLTCRPDREIPRPHHAIEDPLVEPDVVDLVWSTARELGIQQFVETVQDPVTDDHLPLNAAGIKTIDLIDFDYPDASNKYWHTLEDTPDKCSAERLEAVGTVLMHVIYKYPA